MQGVSKQIVRLETKNPSRVGRFSRASRVLTLDGRTFAPRKVKWQASLLHCLVYESRIDMSASNQAPVQRRPLKLSRAEAVVTVLMGCAAVDGVVRAEEASRLNEVLTSSRWILEFGAEAAAGLRARAMNLIIDHGLPAVLTACAEAIPADLRPTTFALAMDLTLADGRLGSRENTLIDELQRALRIDDDLARKIIDVLLIKNRASGRPDL
jgi:tellurite resistance protein